MKQSKSAFISLLYYQEKYQNKDLVAQAMPHMGFGVEIISNGKVDMKLETNTKQINGSIALFKQNIIDRAMCDTILAPYEISEEERNTYIYQRDDELFDEFNVYRHKTNENEFIAVFPLCIIVQYEIQPILQQGNNTIPLIEATNLVRKHLEFIGVKDDWQLEYHTYRILQSNSNTIFEEVPNMITPKQEFQKLEEKLAFEERTKLFREQSLLLIPTFNKEQSTFDWGALFNIPEKLLQ